MLYLLPKLLTSVEINKDDQNKSKRYLLLARVSHHHCLLLADSSKGKRRNGKALWWSKGKVCPDGRRLLWGSWRRANWQRGWAGKEQEKNEPEHLPLPESKEVLKKWWGHVKKTSEPTRSFPTGQFWHDLNIKKNNELYTLDSWLYASYTAIQMFTKTTTKTLREEVILILYKLFWKTEENTSQLILWSQHHPDTQTRQRHHKETTDQYPSWTQRQIYLRP